jgi:hypothetical protein
MEQILLLGRLAQAEQRVADGLRRLNYQRELVMLIRESGRHAENAEDLMRELATAHAWNLAKLQRVRAALARSGYAAQ